MVKPGKRGLICSLPWQTNSIFVIYIQPPERRIPPRFTAICRAEKAVNKMCLCHGNGKMWQVNAVNGNHMVVKIRVGYYRWVKG